MSSRFNRFLRGWLSLLDSKVGGLTPTEYENSVRPTLDIEPFLRGTMSELVWAGMQVTTEGWLSAGNLLLVPDNEIWFVQEGTIYPTSNVIVGDVMSVVPAVELRSIGFALPRWFVLGDQQPMPGATFAHQPVARMSRPYVALPGEQFGLWTVVHNGAAEDVVMTMKIIRTTI